MSAQTSRSEAGSRSVICGSEKVSIAPLNARAFRFLRAFVIFTHRRLSDDTAGKPCFPPLHFGTGDQGKR